MKDKLLSAIIFVCALALSFGQQAFASHLKVDNARVSEVNTKTKIAMVQCSVAWDNSWKDDINCDGVWIFAKYKANDGIWKHVNLSAASGVDFDYADHAPVGFSKGTSADVGMWISDEKKGAFLFPLKGKGTSSSQNVQLAWNYADDGVTDEQIFETQVKVFGIEMVYVPQGKYFAGDPQGPDGPDNAFYAYPNNGAYLVNSEDSIAVAQVDGALYCDQDNPRSREDTPFTIPAEFPKGYDSFWIMKYELTSQQFADFLNTLSRKQQQSMVESDISADEIKNYHVKTNSEDEHLRNSIVTAKKGNGIIDPVQFYTYAPARAINFMSWANIVAIGDWAGLRPITELEYEKACRGPKEAIADEGAWGTTDVGRVDSFDGADGSGYEKKIPQTGLVNACLGGGIAPFDVGKKTVADNPGFEGPVSGEVFENSRHEGVAEKINDGASYYGVRNLSGNLWERCVTVGHTIGRAFTGLHGDGRVGCGWFCEYSSLARERWCRCGKPWRVFGQARHSSICVSRFVLPLTFRKAKTARIAAAG